MTITVTLSNIGDISNTTASESALNNNSAAIESGFTTAVNVTGDIMQGNLDMNSHRITNLPLATTLYEPLRVIDGFSGTVNVSGSGGTGSVTNVALTMPSQFTVSGSPVTTSGTIAVSWTSENGVFASPTGGGIPSFRTLVSSDIPVISLASSVTGNLAVTNLNGGSAASSTTFWRGDGSWGVIPGSSGNLGTVTNVAFTATPTSVLTITGSPITSSGTLALSFTAASSNMFLVSPSATSGAASYRLLSSSDFSALTTSLAIANSNLATAAAYTLKGNTTGTSASVVDFAISGLTSKSTLTSADLVLISDSAASNQFKKTTVGNLLSGISVSSAVVTVTAADSSLTITPTSGAVVANVNLASSFTWGGPHVFNSSVNFSTNATFSGPTVMAGSFTSNGPNCVISASAVILKSPNNIGLSSQVACAPGANLFFGGVPWADVIAWGATNNNAGDSTSSIQAAINYMNTTFAGGIVFFPPGNYRVRGTITVPNGMSLIGSGPAITQIFMNSGTGLNLDTTMFSFSVSSVNPPRMEDMACYGCSLTSSTNPVVTVADNLPVLFSRLIISGGSYGLHTAGNDGTYLCCAIWGSATAGGCVSSNGSNWWLRCSFDANGTQSYGFLQGASAANATGENHFLQCDFSGSYSYSVYINGTGASPNPIMVFTGCIFSSPIDIVSANLCFFNGGCYFGAAITVGTNVTLFTGCASLSGSIFINGTGKVVSGCYNLS